MATEHPSAVPIDVRVMDATATLLVAGLVLLLLALGGTWLLSKPIFAVRHVVITGDTTHSNVASLESALSGQMQGNFFTQDLGAVRRALETAPWVRRAAIQREFPNRLHVELSEYVPVARWGESGTQMVDAAGAVFPTGVADPDAAEEKLPLLDGPDGRAPEMLALYDALEPIAQRMDSRIAELELQPRGHWRLQLASGGEVELGQGDPQRLSTRFADFAATVGDVAARHGRTAADVESADLRYASGYSLRLRGVSTEGGAAPKDKNGKNGKNGKSTGRG